MVLYWSLLTVTCAASLCALVLSTQRYGRWKEKKRVDALTARVLELEMHSEATDRSLKKLVARIGMREHRAKQKKMSNGGHPDPETDPAGWKQSVSGIRKR